MVEGEEMPSLSRGGGWVPTLGICLAPAPGGPSPHRLLCPPCLPSSKSTGAEDPRPLLVKQGKEKGGPWTGPGGLPPSPPLPLPTAQSPLC